MGSALGATGRGKQYLETTDYGLVQYCNALKSVQDEVAKSGK